MYCICKDENKKRKSTRVFQDDALVRGCMKNEKNTGTYPKEEEN